MVKINVIGFCDYHDDYVTESTFEFKGCWNCHYLNYSDDCPYVDVREASEILEVSETTIRSWIKNGKLEGRKFIKQRSSGELFNGSQRKYFITKKSLKKLQ